MVMRKTLAMRLLEGKDVPYEAFTYSSDERDAVMVARQLGVPADHVYKTLVVVREYGKPLLVIVPADRQLDLKKTASALGEKKLKFASHAEAEAMTRLKVGGISPLVLINRGFDMVLDKTALQLQEIFISAGEKGINLRLAVPDILELTGAQVLDVTQNNAA
jgi:Cys-tRNA(Pro)/Cys-tRNA(Cys) deacylase